MKIEFSRQFCKNLQISNFVKIHPVGAEFFHAKGQLDRWMDRTKLIVAFRNFENAPKNTYIMPTFGLDSKIPALEQYGKYSTSRSWLGRPSVNNNKHTDASPYCNFLA